MAGIEHLAPAPTAPQTGRARSLGAHALLGVAAGAAAVLTMAVLCGAGLAFAGASGLGARIPVTAAAVALAAGGRVDFALSVNGRGASALGGLTGGLDLMPLGATIGGALVLAIVLRRPYGKGKPPSPEALAARATGALAGYLALLAVAVGVGHGTVTRTGDGTPTPVPSPSGGELPGLVPGGSARDLGSLLSDGRVLSYDTAAGATLLRGLLVVLLLLAVCWATGPAPERGAWVRCALRPAASAVATMVLAVGAAGMMVGAGLALVRPNGAQALGALLLGWPNAFFAGWTAGLNVPWTVDAAGVFGDRLPAGAGAVLPGSGQQWPKPLLDPSTMDGGAAMLLVVAAAVVTLACGVLTAVRTRRAARSPYPPVPILRRAVVPAVALGGVLAVALPLAVLAAGASGGVGLSLFGFSVTAVTLQVGGGVWQAAVGGLLGGAVAGLLGAFLVEGLFGRLSDLKVTGTRAT